MQFFLDSAMVDEIEYALNTFDIDGITTNPRHVQVSGKPFMTAIKEIAKLVEGTDKTVSVEVNPHIMDADEMVAEAEKLAAISPNFVIKIQCVEPAFKAIHELTAKGIRVNCTLIFSAMQALQARTAEAHQKFLETQAEAGRSLQRMMESTQRLAEATLGLPTATSYRSEKIDATPLPVTAERETTNQQPDIITTAPAPSPCRHGSGGPNHPCRYGPARRPG